MAVRYLAQVRRAERGLSMLLATAVVTLVTMTVLVSLTTVGRESGLQRDLRVRREAFFAAEAGLAEGRQAVMLLLADNSTYSGVFAALGSPAHQREPGLGSDTQPWYDVLPPTAPGGERWQHYTLEVGPAVTESEVAGFNAYPAQSTVRYRVFLHDDDDDADYTQDSNTQVWLVSVGEVLNPEGVPTRSVVRALITNSNSLGSIDPGCTNRGCDANMNFDNQLDTRPPDLTQSQDI